MPLAALSLCAISQVAACAMYSAAPMQATVVDAETRQPLEGAVVVAHWVLEDTGAVKTVGDMELMEAVTDASGRFVLPGWGPKATPHYPYPVRLSQLDPEIIILKPGYMPRSVMNNEHPDLISHPEDLGPATRTSQWNDRVIALNKADDPPKRYAFALGGVLTGVDYSFCKWKKIPRMVVMLSTEKQRLKKVGIDSYPEVTIDDLEEGKKSCGSVKEFFKDYQ
jgi:hypothetical protein